MRYNLLVILLVLTAGCSPPRVYNGTSRSGWPQKGLTPDCSIGNGVVYLKNGNTLTCLVKIVKYYDGDHELDSSESPVQILPMGKTEKKDIQTIYLSDISHIKIQNGNGLDSTELKPFGGTLAFLIGRKNQFTMYCRYWHWQTSVDVNNSLTASSAEILLTFDDKIVSHFATLKKASDRWYDYRQFINKKYDEHFDKFYFKGKDENIMVNYILDQENARLKTGGKI